MEIKKLQLLAELNHNMLDLATKLQDALEMDSNDFARIKQQLLNLQGKMAISISQCKEV